ncbi:MAG: hypothetical protein JO061_13730, partial [Acidobacteriaceae bacterium]|nr:hypothetical protein [Acidobacteriaceae bacterium]
WGDRRQPHLDSSVFDDALCNEFGKLKERLENALVRPFTAGALPGVLRLTLAMALFGIILCILVPEESLRSFERPQFSNLLMTLLLPLAAYTLFTFARFGWCWSLLRAFLVSLNSVVLGRYFTRVPEFGGSGPVWIREVKLMSLATAINGSIALHNLEILHGTPEKYSQEYFRDLQGFLSPKHGVGTRLDFICAYEQFRRTAGRIASTLGQEILRPYWRKNPLPFVGEVISDDHKDEDAHKPQPAENAIAPAPATKHLRLKSVATAVGHVQSLFLAPSTTLTQVVEETPFGNETKPVSAEAYDQAAKFITLQYSIYIGYVLHQLQNLLLCCITCFVLLVAALSSFSFQAPQAIFRLLTAGLIVAGCMVLMAFAQMDRDPILSRLTGTQEGELGKNFYLRALSYGALPVLSLLAAQFPAISRYLSVWIQPATAALH